MYIYTDMCMYVIHVHFIYIKMHMYMCICVCVSCVCLCVCCVVPCHVVCRASLLVMFCLSFVTSRQLSIVLRCVVLLFGCGCGGGGGRGERGRRGDTNRTIWKLIPAKVFLKIAETEQLYQVKRMIGGIGNMSFSIYSQTEKCVRSKGFFGGPLAPSDNPTWAKFW